MPWNPRLDDTDGTLSERIARGIAADIQRGRLRPGQRLPGSRTLASALGVHRNTVNAALDALEVEGLLRTEAARGRFVSEDASLLHGTGRSHRPRSRMPRCSPLTPVPLDVSLPLAEAARDDVLNLAGGLPDARTFPTTLLARSYARVLRRGARGLLGYGDARGLPRLRRALARMLADERGLACGEDDVLVTRGSQQALWLVAQSMLRRGDCVAVEQYGYRPAWDALRVHGARLVPVPVDDDGLQVDRLEAVLRRRRLRGVYLTPHHQFPTLAPLSAPRRRRLLELAEQHGFFILEDDYDHEFHYTGRPLLPLASLDRAGVVLYVGTLSKVLAPGLRVGMAVAPAPVLERMAALRTCIDRQGDQPTEAALAELLEEGELARHVRRNRRIYAARQGALADALRRELGERVRFRVPSGGMALWLEADPAIDVARWCRRAARRGVLFTQGSDYHFTGGAPHHLRVGFARADEGELRSAVRIMRESLAPETRRGDR